ncbi:MAG TPA: T9SS type A sorting domain-containing protein, partial [Phnomibacter sp.]|nr:T9SS type A sorting domain-containing protein [Phnomibacter sp.]
DDARLSWTVEQDQDNKQFEIERGLNPRDFIKVATVNAAGNGRTQNSYEFTDRRLSNLNARTVYYRIKQIDNSGEALYSPVRSVDVDKAKAVSLFPNPVKSVTKLVIDAETAGKATILIRDMSGKTVKQINTQLFKGINQQDLYVAELASGEYNVNVIGQGFNHLLKFTKVN